MGKFLFAKDVSEKASILCTEQIGECPESIPLNGQHYALTWCGPNSRKCDTALVGSVNRARTVQRW